MKIMIPESVALDIAFTDDISLGVGENHLSPLSASVIRNICWNNMKLEEREGRSQLATDYADVVSQIDIASGTPALDSLWETSH